MNIIGVINGPNLGRLGYREPGIYGRKTLKNLEERISEEAEKMGCKVCFFQSNHEGGIVDKINEWADEGLHGAIINPAGYSHTSVAIRDAIAGSNMPFIEVHISNIHNREEFRGQSLTAGVCKGSISGLGFDGYLAGMRHLVHCLEELAPEKCKHM